MERVVGVGKRTWAELSMGACSIVHSDTSFVNNVASARKLAKVSPLPFLRLARLLFIGLSWQVVRLVA